MPKYFLFSVALLWTGVVSYFCLVKSSDFPIINIPHLDKIIHVFFHFVLTFLWFLSFSKQQEIDSVSRPLVYSVLFSLVFGIIIEVLQEVMTVTRSADILDVAANAFGAMTAVCIVLMCNKYNILLNAILKK